MHAHIKEAWLQALRSGEYRQGQHALYWGEKYCCLGVLCDLHSKQTGTSWEEAPGCRFEHTYMSASGLLPPEVVEWAGLDEGSRVLVKVGYRTHFDIALPIPQFGKSEARVSELNDDGKSFKEIADLVEEYITSNND